MPTRYGRPLAAVVLIADLRMLKEHEAEHAHWSRIADEAIGQWGAEVRPSGVPMGDILQELGVDLHTDR